MNIEGGKGMKSVVIYAGKDGTAYVLPHSPGTHRLSVMRGKDVIFNGLVKDNELINAIAHAERTFGGRFH
jgi:hypothetical protein